MIKQIKTREVFASPQALDLIWEYANECSIPGIAKINPQAEMYEALEATGSLTCFGAFDGEILVGFATILVTILPHYGVQTAIMESLFIAQDSRNKGLGTKLLQAVREYAVNHRCVGVLYSTPAGGQLEKVLAATKSCVRTNAVFFQAL